MLAAILTGAEGVVPLFVDNPPLPRRLFAVVVFFIIVAAMIARTVAQDRPEPVDDKPVQPVAPVAAQSAATIAPVTSAPAPAPEHVLAAGEVLSWPK